MSSERVPLNEKIRKKLTQALGVVSGKLYLERGILHKIKTRYLSKSMILKAK